MEGRTKGGFASDWDTPGRKGNGLKGAIPLKNGVANAV
jgi:hypothetical protein